MRAVLIAALGAVERRRRRARRKRRGGGEAGGGSGGGEPLSAHAAAVLASGPVLYPGSALALGDTLAPLLVGASTQGNFPFSGEIDEVAIDDRALDTREIEEHHTVGTTGR